MHLIENANDFIMIRNFVPGLRATNPEYDSEGRANHPEQPESGEATESSQLEAQLALRSGRPQASLKPWASVCYSFKLLFHHTAFQGCF